LSDRQTDWPPQNGNYPVTEEETPDQEMIVSETDVASAGRSCLALLTLFLVIFVILAIWFLYRSTS
jgi:hypothetical protein